MEDDVVLGVANEESGKYPDLLPYLETEDRTTHPIYVAVSPSSLRRFLANLSADYKTRYDDLFPSVVGQSVDLLSQYSNAIPSQETSSRKFPCLE